MTEAFLYQQLSQQKVRCQACHHYCLIMPNQGGICGVRKNKDGKLYTLVYGKVIAAHLDPIEKKPLFHFLPATKIYSIATIGCNFRCLHCQNADISQASKLKKSGDEEPIEKEKNYFAPEEIIKTALQFHCPSIAYTYTEPTIFIEYALDIMKLAKKEGLNNVWVSNGYMSKEAIDLISPYLDAINIDVKAFSEEFYQKICGAKLKPVLENLKALKKLDIWIEITTLIIPTLNDDPQELKQLALWIKNELGDETPWHISRFYPHFRLQTVPPTTLEMLDQAYQIGKKAGLKYVYIGNIPGDQGENTYCPSCGELIIERIGYQIKRFDFNGRCQKCQYQLRFIW